MKPFGVLNYIWARKGISTWKLLKVTTQEGLGTLAVHNQAFYWQCWAFSSKYFRALGSAWGVTSMLKVMMKPEQNTEYKHGQDQHIPRILRSVLSLSPWRLMATSLRGGKGQRWRAGFRTLRYTPQRLNYHPLCSDQGLCTQMTTIQRGLKLSM